MFTNFKNSKTFSKTHQKFTVIVPKRKLKTCMISTIPAKTILIKEKFKLSTINQLNYLGYKIIYI